MGKYIVTITPPTPNGNLHLGHISGPFLAADVLARGLRQQGHEVVFVCYSDDYQSYVLRKAIELSEGRFEVARKFAAEIEKTLRLARISLDWFLKAHDNRYFSDAVTFFYDQAHAKGAIKAKMQRVPYQRGSNIYGYEAFGRGICNYCGHDSDPSQCENCAQAPDMDKMGAIRGTIFKGAMEWKEIEREFLQLHLYKDYLLSYYRTLPLRPYLREFITAALDREDLDWAIDRPGECGIGIHTSSHSNIVHTWFSGIAGYLAAFTEWAHSIRKPSLIRDFWYDKDTFIVHFIGFDCSFSHALVYPSLLYNCDGMTRNVRLFPNKFLKLEGNDFSTSRGIAIWMNDILRDAPVDAVRFYLALHSPEQEECNFERKDFDDWTFHFFLPALRRLERILLEAPPGTGEQALAPEDRSVEENFRAEWKRNWDLEHFSMRQIATTLCRLLHYLGGIPDEEIRRLGPLAKLYVIMGMSIHPDWSGRMLEQIKVSYADL